MKRKLITTRLRALERLEARNMLSAVPYMLGDINVSPAGSLSSIYQYYHPQTHGAYYAEVGEDVLFPAYDSAAGIELWKTDGTTAGTRRVIDISPGLENTFISNLTEHDGLLYFNASRNVDDFWQPISAALWESDGTAEGTRQISSLAASEMISTSNGLIFSHDEGLSMYQHRTLTPLWNESVFIYSSFSGPDKVFFRDDVSLWVTDGSVEGTVRLTDFEPWILAAEDGVVYYTTFDDPGGRVWKTDGTREGTSDTPWVELASTPYRAAVHEGTFYFSTSVGFGTEQYWYVDNSTLEVKQLGDRQGQVVMNRIEFSSRPEWDFYFYDSTDSGELWRTDGTDEGTLRLADFAQSVVQHDDKLLFSDNEKQLWRTDGTIEGTIPIKEITVGHKFPRILSTDNAVYFHGNDGGAAGMELWKSDGTVDGTVLVKDIHPGTADFNVDSFRALGDKIVLTSVEYYRNRHTGSWAFDRSTSEMQSLSPNVPFRNEFVQIGNSLFVVGSARLWKTDGTADGTGQWSSAGGVFRLGALDDELIFTVGRELHKLPNVNEKTTELLSAQRLRFSSKLVRLGDALVFAIRGIELGNDQLGEPGLWRTDGTRDGTHRIIDTVSVARDLTSFGDRILFWTTDGDIESQLWSTDGTSAGTYIVDTFEGAEIQGFEQMGEYVYFRTMVDPSTGFGELWRTDGTRAGTNRVADVRVGNGLIGGAPMIGYGDVLLFAAAASEQGSELWRTDGTAAGTWLVKEIRPGIEGSGISGFEVVDGQVDFAANDGQHGNELWVTDGTAQGTTLVADIRPGPAGSYPTSMTEVDGELFLTANDGVHGREPWRLMLSKPIPGDANGDGTVDGKDLNIVGLNWQSEANGIENGDFTGDGRVDAADLNVLARNWRRTSDSGRVRAALNRKEAGHNDDDDRVPSLGTEFDLPTRRSTWPRLRIDRMR